LLTGTHSGSFPEIEALEIVLEGLLETLSENLDHVFRVFFCHVVSEFEAGTCFGKSDHGFDLAGSDWGVVVGGLVFTEGKIKFLREIRAGKGRRRG
jgi:hypothetical protein